MVTASMEPIGLLNPRAEVRYRFVVLSSNVPDVVRWAGGWLFDRSLAGCQVTAHLDDLHDDRALRILGIAAGDLSDALASQLCDVGDVLVVSADLYGADAHVRERMLEAMEVGTANVIMWGSRWPAELEGLTSSVHHRLSIAARAFKAQALLAAGTSAHVVEPRKLFRGMDLRTCRAACSHLETAS